MEQNHYVNNLFYNYISILVNYILIKTLHVTWQDGETTQSYHVDLQVGRPDKILLVLSAGNLLEYVFK